MRGLEAEDVRSLGDFYMLTLAQKADDYVAGNLTAADATEFFKTAPVLLPVPGVPPYPGESWQAYNRRVGEMIAASRRSLLQR